MGFAHISVVEIQNTKGYNINPARKSYQEIYQFLYQFSPPGESQVIVSMLDGLGTVAQAALHLGNFDVIAFEKDPMTWNAAIKVFSQEIEKLKKKEDLMEKKIQQALDVQKVILKSITEDITDDEVSTFSGFSTVL